MDMHGQKELKRFLRINQEQCPFSFDKSIRILFLVIFPRQMKIHLFLMAEYKVSEEDKPEKIACHQRGNSCFDCSLYSRYIKDTACLFNTQALSNSLAKTISEYSIRVL